MDYAQVEFVETQVWDYLIDKGLSEEATAGVMGNIMAESSFNSDNTNGIGAYGLFQWLGGRKTDLQNFAKKDGRSVDDPSLQLDFFWHEITKGDEGATYTALQKKNQTPEQYAVTFENLYERSGGELLTERQKYAGEYYEKYTGRTVRPTGTVETSNKYGLVWWGDIVKVVFTIAVIVGAVAFLGMAVTSSGKTGEKVVSKVKEKAKEVIKND